MMLQKKEKLLMNNKHKEHNEPNELSKEDLNVGDNVLFRMSHWYIKNLQFVKILFVGEEHVVMYNYERKKEYCVKYDYDRLVVCKEEPKFYVSQELTI